jgi:hypothetical protein
MPEHVFRVKISGHALSKSLPARSGFMPRLQKNAVSSAKNSSLEKAQDV